MQVLYFGYGGYIFKDKIKCHECMGYYGDKLKTKAENAARTDYLLEPCSACMSLSSMHEDMGAGWVHVLPTPEQTAHVYRTPQLYAPAVPNRSEPDEAAPAAAPFLITAPSSSSTSHPTSMSATQNEENWAAFAITDAPGDSSSPEAVYLHSQQQHDLQERFRELNQMVEDMRQHMLRLQVRVETLESERQADVEWRQAIEQHRDEDVQEGSDYVFANGDSNLLANIAPHSDDLQ